MGVSGLKHVLFQVFAANFIVKILTGHPYSQAVQVHLLVQLVLVRSVLEGANVSEEEQRS